MAGIYFAWHAAIAASLKLGSSHRGMAVSGGMGFTREHTLGNDTDQLWELSSPGEAAKAAALLAFTSPDTPLSQPRWSSRAPSGAVSGGVGLHLRVLPMSARPNVDIRPTCDAFRLFLLKSGRVR
ncbi:hypothetical protein BLL36_25100 [Pseudomonas cedrina subsp. cedrina]|uniref:Uncharacterized protein n=1 Tax=Pseudomonas cedrina subsp. cedrina TaxID=76762 RepID=A0A1V2K1I1_PSECE|nr:hypothetical protein BLL36_25100 [Pseudomonas cedrina subsp. cedrina]